MGNALQTFPPKKEQELQEIPPEDENREFTCEICIEPIPNPDRKFKNGDKCSHPFCTDCVIKYIRVQIDDNNVGDIRCPALNCDQTLDPVSCAVAVGQSVFLRWCDVLCESAISRFDKWYCPDRNCNALIVNECAGREKKKKANCPSCKKLYCFKCKGVWHGGRRCRETVDLNDVVLRDVVEKNKWKRCPQCSRIVELTAGCPIVLCRCGIRFCYECGQQLLQFLMGLSLSGYYVDNFENG
ncbi:hypothetical protein ACS0TY_001678 [Phlomoides rotata]